MTDNERKESISALRQLLAMCDFVDQYGDFIDADPYFNAVETAIESLNETGWIPVSERLPEEYTQYLVCFKTGHCYVYWLEDSDWARGMAEKEGIIAWMPLPEPYRDGGEE